MEKLSFRLTAPRSAGGTRAQAIVGVVASGNLEVLLERASPADTCMIRFKVLMSTAMGNAAARPAK